MRHNGDLARTLVMPRVTHGPALCRNSSWRTVPEKLEEK